MWCWWLALIFSCSLALRPAIAQAQAGPASGPSPEPQASTAPASGTEPPADAAVLTINGLCDSGLASSPPPASQPAVTGSAKALDPSCKTVITRQQYENMLNGIGLPPPGYRNLTRANEYAETLVMAEKGRELGVEKDPRFQQKLRFSYVQDLNQYALIRLQEEANSVTDAEVERYYKEHPERFVRSHLIQIAVPKHKEHDAEEGTTPAVKADPDEEAEMHQLALRLQKEAAAGADPDKLQEKAYKIAGNESVPDTDLGTQVPDQIPVEYRKLLFDLKPGQVSELTENDHEYLIFKCTEKEAIPPVEAKSFVRFLRMRDSRRALKDGVKVQFNEEYFGPVSSQEQAGGTSE
jgi:hypothetical protein